MTEPQDSWRALDDRQHGPHRQTPVTNGYAIASLVLGIVWLWWLGSVLALVFGHRAESDHRLGREADRRGTRDRWHRARLDRRRDIRVARAHPRQPQRNHSVSAKLSSCATYCDGRWPVGRSTVERWSEECFF